MIKKLTSSEYAKRYSGMTEQERKEYQKRVGEWLADAGARLLAMTDRPMAKTQNVMQMSARWSREQCQFWQDGVWLLTALADTTDTWLPMVLYTKSAWKSVRKLVDELSQVKVINKTGAPAAPIVAAKESHNNVTAKAKKPPMMIKAVSREYDAATDTVRVQCAVVPARPKHIDQYVHLLPESTQKRAEEVKPLLRDLDAARENMRLLMTDKKASPADREKWAKLATKIDARLHNIYKELDAEWDKLAQSGRVVVDDLGNARVIDSSTTSDTERPPLADEQRERVRALRRFLKDTRRGNGKTREEHVCKWRESYAEMVAIAGPASVTDKVKEAAAHYGINLAALSK